MPAATRWTVESIPDQTGRTVVITGANAGLGYETATALADRGAHVVLACRDARRADAAAARIVAGAPAARIDVAALDLGSLATARRHADAIADRFPRIDVLINNAGVMYPPLTHTEDGFELQFATNHLGHFVVTRRLLPALRAVDGSRVVTVASIAHGHATIDFSDLHYAHRRYVRHLAYAQSKLANLLFARELDRRLRAAGIDSPISVAAHPGVSPTELTRHLPGWMERAFAPMAHTPLAQSPELAALAQLRAATDPAVRGGQYWGPSGMLGLSGDPVPARSSKRSQDPELARRLWEVSEQLTGERWELTPAATVHG